MLLAGALAMQGCQREKQAAPNTLGTVGRKTVRNVAMVVKNPEAPWTKLVRAYAEMAAKDNQVTLHVLTNTSGSETGIQSSFGAVAATESVGMLLEAPSENVGTLVRDQLESFGLVMLAMENRLKDPETGKYLNMPFFGIEDRDLGTRAAQSALTEMRTRQWKASATGTIIFTQADGGRNQARGTAMAEAIRAEGFAPNQVKLIRWTGAADAQSQASAAMTGFANWIILGPADSPTLAGVRAAEAKGMAADKVIGVSIGGLGALDELKKPNSGLFASLLISPKVHGYDNVVRVLNAVKAGIALDPLPAFDNGILMTRENLAQVTEEQMLDKLPAGSNTIQR